MIRNRNNKNLVEDGGNQLATNISLREFAQAVAQFDLASVPKEKRLHAIRAHVLKVTAHHLADKSLGEAISVSHFNHFIEQANREAGLQ